MSLCNCDSLHMRGWMLGALLFLAAVQLSRADCPKSCVCHVSTEVHCTFRYLSAVPDHFSPSVERVNLGYNSITTLGENDFLGLSKLELLLLHSNTIHSVPDRVFRDLKSLQVLKMSHNKIKEISRDMVKGLDSLKKLYFDHNQIEFVNPEAFYNLTNLELVNLESNHLQQLHHDTFITLRHSQVFKVSSIRTINLSENLLQTLPADIFSSCYQMENLFLHGNPWMCDCRMKWISSWTQRNGGVLKCRRDRRSPKGQLCPVCETPAPSHSRHLALMHSDAFSCGKPWIKPELKKKNIPLEEGDFTPLYPKDFIAPLGSMQLNLTDHFHKEASLFCTVQRPTAFDNLTQTLEEDDGKSVSMLTTHITSYLICNIDYEHIQQLWTILAAYSDMPLKLERGLMLFRTPEMVYKYNQLAREDDENAGHLEAEIKASPVWLMQGEISLQLDRTSTTSSTLHLKYQSVVNLRLESSPSKPNQYTWTMIKKDNQTKTEHTVLTGGVVELSCPVNGKPKPSLEWILPDGSRVRAPYFSHKRNILIPDDGRLILSGASASDTGSYWCISTNYLDADILMFRVTVIPPDVEEDLVNGVHVLKSLGEHLAFDCMSSGSPEASVSWILPDHSVLERSHENRQVHENGTLSIQGVTKRDRGFYRCLAANHYGVDLLVSQVMLSEEKVDNNDNEGSGMAVQVHFDSSLKEKLIAANESPSSSFNFKSSQESRTITSDQPFPRPRYRDRKPYGGGLWQRRSRGPQSRRLGSVRNFDRTSRKVDPQKFAAIMKKVKEMSKLKTSAMTEAVKNSILPNDEEAGSGEDHTKDCVIVNPTTLKPATTTTTTAEKKEYHTSSALFYSTTNSTRNTKKLQQMLPKLQSPPTTHAQPTSRQMHKPEELSPKKEVTMPSSSTQPVTSEPSQSDKLLETQLKMSAQATSDVETSTKEAIKAVSDPLEVVVHKDVESQTTFTAVTTTEGLKDEITFQTTQKIKSPHLPAGSTIISQQHIRIIPGKQGRYHKRTFHEQRRIVKPNKIPDIQSYFNKFKRPTVKNEGNASISYQVELTTDYQIDEDRKKTTTTNTRPIPQRPAFNPNLNKIENPVTNQKATTSTTSRYGETTEFSTEYVTSADAADTIKGTNRFSVSNKEILVTTTSNPSREIVQQEQRFGSQAKKNDMNIIKTTASPSTSTKVAPSTLSSSLLSSMTDSHSKLNRLGTSPKTPEKHISQENHSSGQNFGEVKPTKTSSIFNHVTTTSSPSHYRLPPIPPIAKPSLIENTDDNFLSGSGELPDTSISGSPETGKVIRPGRAGKRPFLNRSPPVKSGVSKAFQSSPTLGLPDIKEDKQVLINFHNTPKNEEGSKIKGTFILPTHATSKPFAAPLTYKPRTTSKSVGTTNQSVENFADSLQSSGAKTSGEEFTFEKMNIHEAQQSYNSPNTQTKGPVKGISAISGYVTNPKTSSLDAGFAQTEKPSGTKPRILGGNAASFTVLSNSDAFLPCEAVGNPQPVITWKYFSTTGDTINIKGKKGKFEVWINGTLSIQSANNKDRGQYLCLAENKYGSDKLLVTLSVVAYPSRILEPKVREVKSHMGNQVEITCRAEGRPVPVISWILANRTQVRVHNQENGKVVVSPEGSLIIENVSVYDRGFYKCIASNPAGADTAIVRLQVVAGPPGILEDKRQQIKTDLGQSLWLPCTGQGTPQPTIYWVLRNGSVLLSEKPTSTKRIFLHLNGTLFIKHVTSADDGKYECIATSSTGSERRVVTLTVETQKSPPLIVQTSEQVTELSYGEKLELNCLATGEPKPKILWRLPSKAVVEYQHRMGSRIRMLENGTLIINAVIDKDAGEYICVARSTVGDDLQLLRVVVSMKPAKIESKPSEKKQIRYGNDLKVDCKATGAPKPEISWGLPDGTVVNNVLQSDAGYGGRRIRRYTLFENGTLYVNQVGMSEEGDYTCYAENKVGKDEMHVHITVITAAPKIREPNQTHSRVKPGQNIRFDCLAPGVPKPKIQWILPTNDVVAASNARHLIHVNGSLDIRGITTEDEGEYVCVARNPGGEDRKIYKLEIDGTLPVINGFRQNRTVIKDSASKHSRKLINCKAEGDPPPTITWIMPDNIFLTAPYFGSRINVYRNGTLDIRNVRATDTAEFICIARNDGGEAVMIVQLEVSNVMRRPIFENPFNQRIVSQTGKTTVLNCSAQGYPKPEIVWLLPNGTRLSSGSYRASRHHLSNDGTLVIYNSLKEDSGKYRCGAKNSLGYVEKLILLDVGYKPYILTRPRGVIRGMFGDPLFLHCLSDGTPRPKVFWTIPGGHTLAQPQELGRYQVKENGTLIVKDTVLHDRGNYICRARNDAGEALLTVPVAIVAYRPQITSGPPTSVRATTGIPVHLNCIANGVPKPEITWELPDRTVLSAVRQGHPVRHEVLHPQGTLIIQRPTGFDSGTYKCLAKNQMGADSRTTYVMVL